MPSPVRALAPTPAERLARVLSDLRMGLPCLATRGGTRGVIVAVETLTQPRLQAARLLTKVRVFRAQGIDITEQLPLRVGKNIHNSGYLATKALKSGHAL